MRADYELLEAWRAGDRQAGGVLFDRHFDAVFRFFRNKVAEDAEDLVQQTFLACVRNRDSVRGDASFRTYLFVAARNKLYDHLKKRRREEARIDWGVTSCADLGVSPSAMLAADESDKTLLLAMRQIPIDMQIALELFYFEQLRGAQLAEVLGVPEGTVRSRIRRGREILRERLVALMNDPTKVKSTLTRLEDWAGELRNEVLGPA